MYVCIWSGFPTSDIGYPIKSNRWTTSDQLYITQLLPTEYSFGVCRGQADDQLNIQLVCAGIRRISDWIFIQCMNGSGGLPTKYSVGVCRGQADYWPNIHLVNAGVRRISDWIFIQCIQGSGRWPTEYSVGMCRDLADYWSDIHLVYALGGSELNI